MGTERSQPPRTRSTVSAAEDLVLARDANRQECRAPTREFAAEEEEVDVVDLREELGLGSYACLDLGLCLRPLDWDLGL